MLDLVLLKERARCLLPTGASLSEVIPLGGGPVPIVVFFYFLESPQSCVLGDPSGLLSLSATTGERIGETIFRPEDWEIAYPRGRQARKSALSISDPIAFGELRSRFDQALSVLVPIFLASEPPSLGDREASFAALLVERWEDATQEGFLDQYRAVGWDWFSWLEAVAADARS